MSKRTRTWSLIGILIIATFLRFYHLTTTPPGLYPDEAMDGNNAAEVVQTGHFQVFYPEDNGREGLYVNILAVILKFFPIYEPWIVRLPAAVAGVLTVWGMYLLVAELFFDSDKKQLLSPYRYQLALLAAFLLATSFWHINFSRIGFRAILAPLLLTWALYFLLKSFRSKLQAQSSYLYAIFAGIIYALGFYTYIAFRVTPLLLLLFIPFFRKTPDFWKKVFVFIVVTFLVAAPIGWYFVKNPSDFFGRTSEISVTSAANPVAALAVNICKTLLMFNVHGDNNWRQNVSGAPELWWPVGIIFLLGIIIVFSKIFKKEKKDSSFFIRHSSFDILHSTFGLLLTIFWFLLAMLPVVLSNESIPHALRSILMLPPTMIFAAIGGVWLYHWIENHWGSITTKTIAVVFVVAVAVFAYYDYFIVWAQNPNVPGAFNADYVTIGDQINALPTATPKYVIVNAQGVIARGLPVPVETTMFITGTFTTSTQEAKNIHYLLPDQSSTIPAGTPTEDIFYIN